ncbi:hypothetical protein [Plantactinospora sonchi]|uniref:Uncharacterized protein n=1 Tax=Plantactinospora sonchi TaxID=1544735 RepID=A0ABU7RS76_9ACTN
MRKRVLLLLGAAVTALSLTGEAAPAAAKPAPAPGAPIVRVTEEAAPPNAGPNASCPIVAHGYSGAYMCGTRVILVDWYGDGRRLETFVVSPVRTIWHAWPGSGGWHEMPGRKTGDNMGDAWWSGTATRNISVWANHPTGYWCISDPGSGWTGVWRDC